jgi:hypothetical protein
MIHTHTHTHTHTEVTANRPGIIIKIKGENMHTDRCGNARGKKCHVKGSRKEIKYRTICTEIQRTRNMKLMIIPVMNGVSRTATKGLQNLEAIPGKHSEDSLQRQLY